MVNDTMKSIKISEDVHKKLSDRRQTDESLDAVLKRLLGILPETIEGLSRRLPTRLETATNMTVRDHIGNHDRFIRIGDAKENEILLRFVSPTTNKTIYQVSVAMPNPEGRMNHRVDFWYLNPENELTKISRLRDIKAGEIEIEYMDHETGDWDRNTRAGDDVGSKTANELVGPNVALFVEQALECWGTSRGN